MRSIHLIWLYFRLGIMKELQYRANFFIQIFHTLLSLGVGLVGLALVFQYTDTLAGWGRYELLAVMGVHILVGGLIATVIQPNMERLMGDVQQGTLDYALTKPEDAQLLVSVRETRIWQIVDVITGLIVVAVAVLQLRQAIGVSQALGFGVALLLGGLIIYSFWLILASGSFWFVRMGNIVEVFQSMYQAGRWPVGVYPDWLRTGLTFLVPVAFAVTVPAEALTGRLTNPGDLLTAVFVTAAMLVLSRGVWKLSLRRYTGASA